MKVSAEVAGAIREAGFPVIYFIMPLHRYDVIRQVIGTLER